MKTTKELNQLASENMEKAIFEVLLDMREILFAMHPIAGRNSGSN